MDFEIKEEKLRETIKEYFNNPKSCKHHEWPKAKYSFNFKEPFWLAELKCMIGRKMFMSYLKYKILNK
jgi:hypothetical protein